MSKCDLSIVVDRPDGRYRLGETVTGRVEVRVDADCRCNGLKLILLWQTHGRGNRAYGPTEERILFEGDWRAGEVASYPFEVALPPGPATYRGHYLNVDYYLRATADIPWAFDPKTETEVLVELGDDPAAFVPGVEGRGEVPAALQQFQKARGIFMAAFGGCFMLPGLAMIVGGIVMSARDSEALVMVLMGAIFALAGAGVAFMGLRNILAERKLGEVDLDVQPRRCAPGDTLRVSLGFMPKGDAEINEITATLRGREVVVSGSGTNRTTHSHVLHEEKLVLQGRGQVRTGHEVALQGELPLPDDAPFSFSARDNNLMWNVQFHIDIASWPDWTRDVSLIVGPRG